MNFTEYNLGHLKRGAVVVVTLSGSAANVRLMNSTNRNSYKAGRRHEYFGGLVKSSPFRISVPADGNWYLTVDLQGLRGPVRSSVTVEPPLLPALPLARSLPNAERNSLSFLRENAHPDAGHQPTDDILDPLVWDVFISHASEDKSAVAIPLATELERLGVKVWMDSMELHIGDSLRRKIDQGLTQSRFGIVILSKSFFAKEWPQYELDGLVTRQNSGQQVILPIWHEITKDELVRISPSLADKVARNTADSAIEQIAAEIASVAKQS